MSSFLQYLLILPILALALHYCWKRLISPWFGSRKMTCGGTSCRCDVSSNAQ